jgi:hypothetical protein
MTVMLSVPTMLAPIIRRKRRRAVSEVGGSRLNSASGVPGLRNAHERLARMRYAIEHRLAP